MSDRAIIHRALHDAIDWQMSFAEANHKGSPERATALALVKRYKAILKRRYGSDRLVDNFIDDLPSVPITELMKRQP